MSGFDSEIRPSASLSGAPTTMTRSKENFAGMNEKSRGSIEPFSGVMKILYSSSFRSVRIETMSFRFVLKERMNSRTPETEERACSGGLRNANGFATDSMWSPARVTVLPRFSRKAPIPAADPNASPEAFSGIKIRTVSDFSKSSLN